MALNTLQDLYHDQLQDIWSANKQALAVVNELGRAATDKALSEALIDGSNGISQGMEKVAQICAKHDLDPSDEHCRGMEGLVKEARAHALQTEFGDPAVRDAMIITQYQRMVHYALAGYGCLLAFANRLNLDEDGAILEKCLDDTYDGDRRCTEIATGGINKDAAA